MVARTPLQNKRVWSVVVVLLRNGGVLPRLLRAVSVQFPTKVVLVASQPSDDWACGAMPGHSDDAPAATLLSISSCGFCRPRLPDAAAAAAAATDTPVQPDLSPGHLPRTRRTRA